MCKKVICETCKKTTWAGCGKHVDETMKDVPVEQRCVCPRVNPVTANPPTAK